MFYDFDEVIEAPIHIKVLGRDRVIKPISLETLIVLSAKAQKIEKGEFVSDIATSFHEIFELVMDDMPLEDVRQMTAPQIAGIYALILRRINGESAESIAGVAEKKKTLAPTL